MASPQSNRFSTVPASAVESSPVSGALLMGCFPLLSRLAELQGRTGCLSLGSTGGDGAVLLENGRVCWATTPRMPRRLTDLLRFQRSPALSAETIEEVYRQCRQQGVPLGEALVRAGYATSEELRRALRQHIAECIALIGEGRVDVDDASWRPHVRNRYDAQFTFSVTELMTTLGALGDVRAATRARECLKRVLGDSNAVGIAYSLPGAASPSVPIGAVNADHLIPIDVVELATWAQQSLQIAECLSPNPVVASRWKGGVCGIVWTFGSLRFVTLCSSDAISARVLSRLSRIDGEISGPVSLVNKVSGPRLKARGLL